MQGIKTVTSFNVYNLLNEQLFALPPEMRVTRLEVV
jgi:hypothetical protein